MTHYNPCHPGEDVRAIYSATEIWIVDGFRPTGETMETFRGRLDGSDFECYECAECGTDLFKSGTTFLLIDPAVAKCGDCGQVMEAIDCKACGWHDSDHCEGEADCKNDVCQDRYREAMGQQMAETKQL